MSPIPENKEVYSYYPCAELTAMKDVVRRQGSIQRLSGEVAVVFRWWPYVAVEKGLIVPDSFPEFHQLIFYSGLGSDVIQRMYWQFGVELGFAPAEMVTKMTLMRQAFWGRERAVRLYVGESHYARPCQLKKAGRDQQIEYPLYTPAQREILGVAMILPPKLFSQAIKNGILVATIKKDEFSVEALAVPGRIFSQGNQIKPPVAEDKLGKETLYLIENGELNKIRTKREILPVGVLRAPEGFELIKG